MPEFLEKELKESGEKRGFTGDRLDKYVYGGMNTIGAMRGSQTTAKGEAMERKHRADQVKKARKK